MNELSVCSTNAHEGHVEDKENADMTELGKEIDVAIARWKKVRAVFSSQDILALSYVAYHLERRSRSRATTSAGVIDFQDDLAKLLPRFNSPELADKVQSYPDFEKSCTSIWSQMNRIGGTCGLAGLGSQWSGKYEDEIRKTSQARSI